MAWRVFRPSVKNSSFQPEGAAINIQEESQNFNCLESILSRLCKKINQVSIGVWKLTFLYTIVLNKLIYNVGVFKQYAFTLLISTGSLKKNLKKRKECWHFQIPFFLYFHCIMQFPSSILKLLKCHIKGSSVDCTWKDGLKSLVYPLSWISFSFSSVVLKVDCSQA